MTEVSHYVASFVAPRRAKFGDEKWAINYVTPVRGHELTTRAQLLRTQPDHPRADEPCYS